MAERPLSPHITVYRWAYTMTLSILHRVTGVALAVALIGLVAWLVAASMGADSYAALLPLLTGVPGKLAIALAVAALIYHFCNGLRHLAWDLGADARRSAVLVVAATLIGAVLCLYFIFRGAGAA
jgi:succinate dehydrogenase cytochrome b subunit